jgi:hypothetical protein
MPIVNTRGTAGAKSYGYTNGFPLRISYVAVAGGGGGATSTFGAGAGQYLAGTTSFIPATTLITITIGAGGPGSIDGGTGGTTTISGVVSCGGGYASGVSGNGYVPGSGTGTDAFGGGAGSSGNGGPGTGGGGGTGGPGSTSSISGSSQTIAGGGGGGGYYTAGIGTDGGGNGGQGTPSIDGQINTPGLPAVSNTGSGGGGSGLNTGLPGGAGGSGIVIIRYRATSQKMTGGTLTSYTTAGVLYYVHTFYTSGTLTWL